MRKPLAQVTVCVAATVLLGTLMRLEGAGPSELALGEQTFSACAACHGLDGRGGEHAPDIATSSSVQRLSDAALLAIIEKGIPAAGMPGFGKLLNDVQIQAVLKYLRTLQRSDDTGQIGGQELKGRELFFGRARCGGCHMVNGRGGFIAVDLSGYGQGHSAAMIREAIVEPNKNLDPRHAAVTVKMRSGKQYRGAVRNQDNFSLQMQTTDGSFLLFDKSDLIDIEHEPGSLMPSDYKSKLTSPELDDLVSYLSQKHGVPKRDEEEEE